MAQKEINTIIKSLKPYFKEKGVKKAILFGSLSRGSQSRKSDIDIMIVQDTDKRFFNRYDTFEDIDKYIQNRDILYPLEDIYISLNDLTHCFKMAIY